MHEGDGAEPDSRFIVVRSESTVLASAANKLGNWVGMKMEAGWVPHGSPQIHNAGEKFYMIQAMKKP